MTSHNAALGFKNVSHLWFLLYWRVDYESSAQVVGRTGARHPFPHRRQQGRPRTGRQQGGVRGEVAALGRPTDARSRPGLPSTGEAATSSAARRPAREERCSGCSRSWPAACRARTRRGRALAGRSSDGASQCHKYKQSQNPHVVL